ncbi:hypothetical protein L0337_28440 [candidate division KSB1 bacterium]|nr:hypothetical protein [candidate division KSB1 bacterium]
MMEYYLTRKVEEVYPDSTADVIQNQDSVITRVDQEKVPNPHEEAMNGVPILMKVSKSGTYQEVRALKEVPTEAQTNFENMQLRLQNQPGLPAKALKINEAWNDETVLLQNSPCCGRNYEQTVTQKSTSTLLGFDNYMDVDCAKVQFSGTVTGTEQNCRFTYALNGKVQGTKLFNYKTGKEIKTTTNMDVVMNSANSRGKMEYQKRTVITEELLE